MPSHVFTYGTLMFELVWLKVTVTTFKNAKAQICGFRRTAVKGQVYPALIPGKENDKVDGIIYFDINDYIIRKLDRFEGHAYNRQRVEVDLRDGSKVFAQTYVLKKAFFSIIEDKIWDQQHFAERYLKDFLDSDI